MRLNSALEDPAAVLVYRAPRDSARPNFRDAAEEALRLAGLGSIDRPVVVKPNVTIGERFCDPDSGITTHPDFVEGIIDYLRDRGARSKRITILEDPRNTDDDEPRHWRGTGYPELAQRTDATLACPTVATCVSRPVPRPHVFEELAVSREAVDPESILINVPKLKTHNLAITTLCMKNLMGVVNGADRHYCRQSWLAIPEERRDGGPMDDETAEEPFDTELHELWQRGLAGRLADTAQVVTPDLNIVEGVVGRDGTGFRQGRNHNVGLVVIGINMVAVDTVASYLMGFDPSRLIYLTVAAEAGLGTNDIRDIRVLHNRDGKLTPCADIEGLRINPPFEVISSLHKSQKVHP